MNIDIVLADYGNAGQAADIVPLLNAYALDPMGGGRPLSDRVRRSLVSELAQIPGAFSVLAYADGHPAGLVNCFQGFSTFKCQPLLNIHDVVVSGNYRGLGISRLMLQKVEDVARERGCCKLTLEVLEGNETARRAYLKFGFAAYELDPVLGQALFWEKNL